MIDLFKKKNPKIGIYGLADLILIISLIVGIVALILTTTLKANASLILIFIVGILIVISRFIRGNRVDSFIGKYNLVLEAIISVFCFGIVPMVMTILTVGMNHYSTIVVCGIYLILCIISVSYNLARDLNKDSIKLYIGLPVTYMSFLYPLINIICNIFDNIKYEVILTIFMLLIGILYIIPIKINRLVKESK